ncbi:hypothetical protein BG015_000350 [Linnemannia schmuckeri]|uniref:Uncharacterized protein n=1 Tax=Linnemannia schmuckeri TaxID=64567 RepID=A0A9P5RR70_9FUNG|nr:hypothetical protein BG015_000350 [Linnemannia schmuckeri]
MWSAKDKQQRPPTPRWNPSIIVSPTTSLLHQRRNNPKAGRHLSPLRQSVLTENNDSDATYLQQHEDSQKSLTLTSSFVTGDLTDMYQNPASTLQQQQLQHGLSMTVDPRHMSLTTQPDHTLHDDTLLAIRSLPQVSFAQPDSRTREPIPPSSLMSLSFSPTFAPPQWNSQDVSPFPYRPHSDTLDQSVANGHVVDGSDSHLDVGPSPSSSTSRGVHPAITGGKCPRPQYGGQNVAFIRPSRLSFVETASPSDDQSSFSPQTPLSKIPSAHGSSSARRRTAYPGSSSSPSTTPSSVTLSPLSDEPRTEMHALIRQYNISNVRQVRRIMDEKLPSIYKDCDALVHSMTESSRLISEALKPIHDFGRLPAREFKQPHILSDWQPTRIKTEKASCQDTRDENQNNVVLAFKGSRAMDIHSSKDDAHLDVIKEEEGEVTQGDEASVNEGHNKEHTKPSPKRSSQDTTKCIERGSPSAKSPLLNAPSPRSPPIKTTAAASPLIEPTDHVPSSYKIPRLEEVTVKQLSEETPPCATSHYESDSKNSPQASYASRDTSSSECLDARRKRKRDQGSTSEPSEPTSVNVALLSGGGRDEHAAPGGGAYVKEGQTATSPERQITILAPSRSPTAQHINTSGSPPTEKNENFADPFSKKQSPPRSLVDKKGPSVISTLTGDLSSQAKIVKLDTEFTNCMHSFMDCCLQLQLHLQQPIQIATLAGPDGTFESSLLKASTPMHHSGELQKAIKGGNDILLAVEQYYSERADLLDRMGLYRSNSITYTHNMRSGGRAPVEKGAGMAMDGKEHNGVDQSAPTQLQQFLEMMDKRHSNQVRFGAMELRSRCAALHQMLESVFS